MVYFKENPDLTGLKVVTTINGEKEYRKNCKYIKQQYYVINKDCFEIENTWYRTNSENIVYDWEKETYVLKKGNKVLIHGLVKNKQNQLEYGYFTPDPCKNVKILSDHYGVNYAISQDILGGSWFEDLRYNAFIDGAKLNSSNIQKRKTIANSENPAGRGYNIEDNSVDFNEKFKSYTNYKTHITSQVKKLSKYVGNLSFGFEFELALGNLPLHLQHRYGVVPCRDGSLNGGIELVTVPMTGAKGLQTVINLTDDLAIRGLVDTNCSLHIHFGNIGNDKLSVIALYRLCRILQEELFTMFPYYKTDHNGIKQKNYTKKLQKLNIGVLTDYSRDAYEAYLLDSWNKLFNFYAEKTITLSEFNKKTREHPIHNKWSRNSRYYYFNFMNMFFTHRHTVEARLSGPTTNRDKVLNWFLICNAIIKYSQKYAKQIITKDRTISIKEVLDIYPTLFPNCSESKFLSNYLYNYFVERQVRFKKDYSQGDYISMWDINDDKEYKYSYMGRNLLV